MSPMVRKQGTLNSVKFDELNVYTSQHRLDIVLLGTS